jgi:Ca2+-binding EF-hand superfamily protein
MNQTAVSVDSIDNAIRQIFNTYDKNNDGKLSMSEL